MRTLLALLCAALTCLGVETELWTHRAPADYESAKLKKLVLRSDGRLTLAPTFPEVHDASLPYLWAVVEDSKGRVFIAGGGPETGGKVFEVAPEAPAATRAKVLGTFTELQVQALAVDKQDRVYAATSPDGKVYRITSGKAEVFYDPKAKYIWALAFNQAGDLFVATGDQGVIHRVTPGGQGSVFYQSGQSHVRSLAIDQKQNVIAGTEPSGYIISINPTGQGFVVHQSPKREVTAVAVHPQGWIYAAAVGAKQSQPSGAPPSGPAPVPTPVTGAGGAAQRGAPPPPAIPSMSPSMSGGSEVYRIEADGFTRKLWSHATDFVYSIAFDAQGNAVLGTGNQGKLIRLDSDLLSSVLVSASPTQITALAPGKGGRIWATTGNIGKLYSLGPQVETSGTLESAPLDSQFFSYWGRAHLTGSGLSSAKLEVRSGNHDDPDKGWSAWAVVPSAAGGRVPSPAARFLQYRLTLSAPSQGSSPEVREIEIARQEKNVAPVVEMVEATPPNYRFPAQSLALTPSTTLSLPAMRGPKRNPPQPAPIDSAATMNAAKGFRGVRWLASDENGDALEAKLEIRGVSETAWKLLKDRTTERHYSWDTTAFADGQYMVRITVSDVPDNTPQQALQSTLESDPFLIDNTPPVINSLQAARTGGRITATWKAADSLNPIARAEYSVNGGTWTVVEPTTKLSDSLAHEYSLTIDSAPVGEVTVAVRLADEFDNQAAANIVVR